MKRPILISIITLAALAVVLTPTYVFYHRSQVVDRILASDPSNELSSSTVDLLATRLTTPGAVSDEQFEALVDHAIERTTHDDEWLFILLMKSAETQPSRSADLRHRALDFINQNMDSSGAILNLLDLSQSPVKPWELDLEFLLSEANEVVIISIYQSLQDEVIEDGESLYAILEERDVVSAKVLGLYKQLLIPE